LPQLKSIPNNSYEIKVGDTLICRQIATDNYIKTQILEITLTTIYYKNVDSNNHFRHSKQQFKRNLDLLEIVIKEI